MDVRQESPIGEPAPDEWAGERLFREESRDPYFWRRLEENHPVLNEVVWWTVIGLSAAAAVIGIVTLMR